MPKPTKQAPVNKGRTLDSFRAHHDKDVVIPNKIKAALAAMAKHGPEHHEYEADFCKLGGLSVADLAKYRDLFKAHIVEVKYFQGKALGTPKNVWFHNTKVAAKLRAPTPED